MVRERTTFLSSRVLPGKSAAPALKLSFERPILAADGVGVEFECAFGPLMSLYSPSAQSENSEPEVFSAQKAEWSTPGSSTQRSCCSLALDGREVVVTGTIQNGELSVTDLCEVPPSAIVPARSCDPPSLDGETSN